MSEAGADIIDVGGESTRPGASGVDLDEERRRVLPVIEALGQRLTVPLSVDTSKPELMSEAVAAGAALVNDVRGLREPGALEAVAALDAFVCLMHMKGEPRTMQDDPQYDDVVAEVGDFLDARISACQRAGIARERLLVDPGFGFAKNNAHNLTLLRRLRELVDRFGDLPVLVGMSRKRTVGAILGNVPPEDRLYGSVAVALMAAERGARIVRVHDVRPTKDALAIAAAAWHA